MLRRHFLLTLALGVTACGGDVASMRPEPAQEFVIEVEGERFRLRTTNPATATALEARRRAGTLGVVAGRLVRGDGGFNAPWSWHLDPLSIEVPDASIELCDGRPSMVQNDLDYWVDTVHTYCPWSARVYGVR
ncbi:MAG TPA: hypothetical protein VJ650_03100 [Gemmatimonadaceae bacterium]|nr:hypothetical protein [Gemmatimonadaceae bacterium]